MKALLCFLFIQTLLATKASDTEAIYKQALSVRKNFDATRTETLRASALLMKAVGVTYDQLKPSNSLPLNFTTHRGILRELAFALESGRGVPKNERLSFELMNKAAQLGDPEAHGEMSVRYAFGFAESGNYEGSELHSFSKADQRMSLLHASFGAQGNDSTSQMILGFKHWTGHGAPLNCLTAAAYYNAVAEKVVDMSRFPGTLPTVDQARLGLNSVYSMRRTKIEQWLQYYQYSADLGDVDAQTTVGQLFNLGATGIRRDYSQAFYYFKQAAEAGDAAAMGHLGHMYANGLGVEANNETALEWFRKAADMGDPEGQYGLGYMYLVGYGVEKNLKLALSYLTKAAAQEHTEAQFSVGAMHLKGLGTRVSPYKALTFLTTASQGGHILAKYNVAMMHLTGMAVEADCSMAVTLLKEVADQGPWSFVLQQGHQAFQEGDHTRALLLYFRAAHMGYELGQSNAAWMLEHGLAPGNVSENIQTALDLYKWSAEQENTNSLLAVGDIFYYGRGIEKDWNRSAGVYQLAEKHRSSRAAFNLGFMYQFGAGLPKDRHLAKRFYDLAATYNSDATYAIRLALLYLNVHSWWERARAGMPEGARAWIDPLFTCKYENESHVPAGWWSSRSGGTRSTSGLGRLIGMFDIELMGDVFSYVLAEVTSEDLGDFAESIILAGVIVLLIAMYRRRRRNRNQAVRQRQNEENRGEEPPQEGQ